MATARLFLFVGAVMLAFAGSAVAMDISGVVSAVDHGKGNFVLKTETASVSIDCEKAALLKDIKVGDTVTVQYTEEGAKKLANSITRIAHKKEAAPKPYSPSSY